MSGRVRVYIATSLDGFIAGPGDELGWLSRGAPAPGEPAPGAISFEGFLADVGALLMGRRTYEVVSGFGPEAWSYGERPVLVATRRPLAPARATVRAVAGSIDALLDEALAAAGGQDVYVDGGAMCRAALDAGRVDELVITVVPVVLGRGHPLFAGAEVPRGLTFEEPRRMGGMVQLVARPEGPISL